MSLTNAGIAERLHITERTVETHVRGPIHRLLPGVVAQLL